MLYQNNCGRCHNNDGAGVVGVELFKQFRRATTDDDIAKLIQNGIPGTSMPSHRFSTPQALSVVAFLRSMVGATPGAAAISHRTPLEWPRGRRVSRQGDLHRQRRLHDLSQSRACGRHAPDPI